MSDEAEVLEIDFDDLTLGDVEDLEEHAGINIEDLSKVRTVDNGDGTTTVTRGIELSTKVLIVLAWIIKRKTNPEYTLDDARKLKLAALSNFTLNQGSLGNTQSGSDSTSK